MRLGQGQRLAEIVTPYRGLELGFWLFFADIWLLLARSNTLADVLLVVTSAVTMVVGVRVMVDHDESVEALRLDLKRRGRRGVIVDWPDYFWRAAGFAVAILGLPGFFAGWASLLG